MILLHGFKSDIQLFDGNLLLEVSAILIHILQIATRLFSNTYSFELYVHEYNIKVNILSHFYEYLPLTLKQFYFLFAFMIYYQLFYQIGLSISCHSGIKMEKLCKKYI